MLQVQQAMLQVQQAMLQVQQAMLKVQQAMLREIKNKANLSPAELELELNLAKICKIVAYGCQTPSAQRCSDQFPLAPMGVFAPRSAHARPSARPPIDTSGNFSAHMSGGGEIV